MAATPSPTAIRNQDVALLTEKANVIEQKITALDRKLTSILEGSEAQVRSKLSQKRGVFLTKFLNIQDKIIEMLEFWSLVQDRILSVLEREVRLLRKGTVEEVAGREPLHTSEVTDLIGRADDHRKSLEQRIQTAYQIHLGRGLFSDVGPNV